MPQSTVTLEGTYEFVVPDDVSTIDNVEAWGSGGGGGGAGLSNNAQGGGGGAYSATPNLSVTPGAVVSVTCAAGGAGNTGNGDGGAGGDSFFIDAATVMAKGGAGGLGNTNTTPGGAGGAAGSGVGTTKFSGGQGGGNSGGGGGSAGSGGAGGDGGNGPPSGAAGTAGSGGGAAGGAGGPNAGAGLPGNFPGGAGGGGDANGGDGGDGAAGLVKLTISSDYPILGGVRGAPSVNGTSLVFPRPVGAVSGSLLVVFIGSGSVGQFTAPADAVAWTEHFDTAWNSSGERGGVFYKICGSSEPSSYTFTCGNSGALCGSIHVVAPGTFDPTTPINASAESDQASTTTPTTPSVTTTVSKCMLFQFLAIADDLADADAPATSGQLQERFHAGGGAGSDLRICTAYDYAPSAGATGDATWSLSTGAPCYGVTIAIAPVPVVATQSQLMMLGVS